MTKKRKYFFYKMKIKSLMKILGQKGRTSLRRKNDQQKFDNKKFVQ